MIWHCTRGRKRKNESGWRKRERRNDDDDEEEDGDIVIVGVCSLHIHQSEPCLCFFSCWQVRRAIRKAETEKPSFLLGFFLVSVILYFDKKHTHTRPSFIIVFLLSLHIYYFYSWQPGKKKKGDAQTDIERSKEKKKKNARKSRTKKNVGDFNESYSTEGWARETLMGHRRLVIGC